MLALAEAGAKKAQHLSTEKNIEASDLYNLFQAKKFARPWSKPPRDARAQSTSLTDPKAQEAVEEQIADFKTTVANFEKDPKKPEQPHAIENGDQAK